MRLVPVACYLHSVKQHGRAEYEADEGSYRSSVLPHRGEEGLKQKAKFIVYRDFKGGYRWRLHSGEGATIASSESGHHGKAGCEQEMKRWMLEYPDASVRDATIRGFVEHQRARGSSLGS
jgi:uncharacterized protein YegP (UPF0339 family)